MCCVGIKTDGKRIAEMIARITAKALTKAALEAHGLKSLQSSLRTTDGGIAPSAIVHPQVPAMLPPGQQPTGPLPTLQFFLTLPHLQVGWKTPGAIVR